MLFSALLLAAITWPPGARIIERAPVPSPKGPRELVLWMTNPVRVTTPPDAEYCGTYVHGDYWKGPSHLSLVDPAADKILNTIRLEKDLPIPFFVLPQYWRIPKPDGKGRGKPQILDLRDLTGEGNKSQFVLFRYEVCGISDTSLAGYSARADRAVRYPVLDRMQQSAWAGTAFARPYVRPGHWDFVWTPAHGVTEYFRERLDFDSARQLFISDSEISPNPDAPNYLPPGARIINQQKIEGIREPRALVIWIEKPRYFKPPPGTYGCSDFLYGGRWSGIPHLSLINPDTNRVINTIDLPRDIPIPVVAGRHGYRRYSKDEEGHVTVLDLQDLTGEGVKGQFYLLEYMNCGTNITRAYGYSPAKNRVVQYPILSQGKLELSIPVIFQQPQTVPGLWKFVHYGDHGDDAIYNEHVIFDRARQIFVREVRITKQRP